MWLCLNIPRLAGPYLVLYTIWGQNRLLIGAKAQSPFEENKRIVEQGVARESDAPRGVGEMGAERRTIIGE